MKCRRCGKEIPGDPKPRSDTAQQELCRCEKREDVWKDTKSRDVKEMRDETEGPIGKE